MIILSSKEFNYIMVNGKMYKYLRYFNRFSRDDEPLMILDSLGKKRVGTCKTTLVCILQGAMKIESFERYIKDTPYATSQDWIDNIDKLYGDKNMFNGYIFLLELNKVVISLVNNHPSCKGCVNANNCGVYKDLRDANYCEDRLSNIDVDGAPLMVIKNYRNRLNYLYKELDKLRELDDRTDIIIKIAGLMQDIRRHLNA